MAPPYIPNLQHSPGPLVVFKGPTSKVSEGHARGRGFKGEVVEEEGGREGSGGREGGKGTHEKCEF